MSGVVFTIPGPPVPKGRARTFMKGGRAITTTPPRTRRYEKHVRACAKDAAERSHFYALRGDRLNVELLVYVDNRRRTDIDNLGKAVLDGCNGVIWDDDEQIDRLLILRQYDRENPRTEVRVWCVRTAFEERASEQLSKGHEVGES